MAKNYRKIIKASMRRNAGFDVTITGPEATLTGKDEKGMFEILLDDVSVEVVDISAVGPSGDGWNEPRDPGGIEDYTIESTNIGVAETKHYNGKRFDVDNLPIKYYPETDEEETVTDPTQLKAISDFYIEKLNSDLSEKTSEAVNEAAEKMAEDDFREPDDYDPDYD
jgi:hypothetical protein